ncbi:MAG: 2'-5' RNA ligase family protein, partial [Kordiimonas sp.]
YKPHVTLARFRRGAYARIATWLSVNGVLRSPTETIRHFTLFSSHLTSEGPIYQVEAQFGTFVDDAIMADDFALEVCA